MKANRKVGMWKAIAFLTVVISFFSCCPDDELNKASVSSPTIENITDKSATFVANVTPNQTGTSVAFYYAIGNDWEKGSVEGVFDGNKSVSVTLNVANLRPSTLYKVKAVATNASGSTTSKVTEFTTANSLEPVIVIKPAENITISTAKLVVMTIPWQDNVSVSFEYQVAGHSWQSQSLPNKVSGTDSVKVTFDLFELQANTQYNFRVKIGEKLSDISSFMTYAVSDFDGNLYHTVTIGTQTWLKENFKGTHFSNGDSIPNVTDQTAWNNLTTPGYCYYNNDQTYAKVYGSLYNFYAFNDLRGLIVGFHSPSLEEWTTLSDYLGGKEVAGGKMKEAGYEHWVQPNEGATNSSGFTALPSGARKETFGNLGDWSVFWSTTKFMGMSNVVYTPDLGEVWAKLQLIGGSEFNRGFSIRLVKN